MLQTILNWASLEVLEETPLLPRPRIQKEPGSKVWLQANFISDPEANVCPGLSPEQKSLIKRLSHLANIKVSK